MFRSEAKTTPKGQGEEGDTCDYSIYSTAGAIVLANSS